MTLAFPLLVMKGTVTDNTEICIADLTGGVSGGGRGELREPMPTTASSRTQILPYAADNFFFFFYVIAGHRL